MHSCDIWQRWARPSLAQRQPTRESTIWIWQLCHVTEHSKSHIWDRTLRSTEIKIPYGTKPDTAQKVKHFICNHEYKNETEMTCWTHTHTAQSLSSLVRGLAPDSGRFDLTLPYKA